MWRTKRKGTHTDVRKQRKIGRQYDEIKTSFFTVEQLISPLPYLALSGRFTLPSSFLFFFLYKNNCTHGALLKKKKKKKRDWEI
jgi:hypothetical protein